MDFSSEYHVPALHGNLVPIVLAGLQPYPVHVGVTIVEAVRIAIEAPGGLPPPYGSAWNHIRK